LEWQLFGKRGGPYSKPFSGFCVYKVMPLLQDIRDGFRTLTRSPGFSAIAVAVLAFAGVNAAGFYVRLGLS
jgi:hypothetical protein